jgi:hypothetical protein
MITLIKILNISNLWLRWFKNFVLSASPGEKLCQETEAIDLVLFAVTKSAA